MGGVDAYGNTEQKFHLLGTVETTNNTTQYLELTGLDTSYAMIEFVFTGWIDHSGGGGTNIGSGQFTNGPTIQMQGAWPGGTHSSAAHYRAINVYQNGATTGVYHRIGDSINTSSVMLSPNWGRIGKLFYQSGSNAEENRFTVNFVCVGPGDNTQKTIKWDGGGNAGPSGGTSSYMSSAWTGSVQLCSQTTASAVRCMDPMDSIRIGAGTDNAGTAKYFGSYSSLSAYGMGKSDAFGR